MKYLWSLNTLLQYASGLESHGLIAGHRDRSNLTFIQSRHTHCSQKYYHGVVRYLLRFLPHSTAPMGRMVGLRGVPESAHPLAILKELFPVDCCQGRWCLPPYWSPPGRLSSSGVSWQISRSQHEPYIHLFSDVYRLQVAFVTWLKPSLGLFDFICVVIFIRWPGSLFPSHSSVTYVGLWSGSSGRQRLSQHCFWQDLCHSFYLFIFLSNAAKLACFHSPTVSRCQPHTPCLGWGTVLRFQR